VSSRARAWHDAQVIVRAGKIIAPIVHQALRRHTDKKSKLAQARPRKL
jgi:hypothetical protein